jgi:hypothetical protein
MQRVKGIAAKATRGCLALETPMSLGPLDQDPSTPSSNVTADRDVEQQEPMRSRVFQDALKEASSKLSSLRTSGAPEVPGDPVDRLVSPRNSRTERVLEILLLAQE